MRPSMWIAAGALAGLTGAAGGQPVVVNFDFYPGPDGRLGTGDDIPIVAPTLFSTQTEQLTSQFETEGIKFIPAPPVNDKNEILISTSFSTPPQHTRPNLLASSGTATIEAEFTVPVFKVEALIGISGGADTLEVYDAANTLLDSRQGDDQVVTIETTTPIARIRIFAHVSTTPAIDNLTFEAGQACYPDCDTSTGPGVLDIFDFLCFQNRYSAGAPYACDCDTSTGPGVCDIFDFLCFQNAFDAGCP